SEATASKYTRESQTQFLADVEAERLLNYFLGMLNYDAADDVTGVSCALRGHSLARNLYGWDPTRPNFIPHSGPGTPANYTYPVADPVLGGKSAINLPNYTYFRSDSFVRDPERL